MPIPDSSFVLAVRQAACAAESRTRTRSSPNERVGGGLCVESACVLLARAHRWCAQFRAVRRMCRSGLRRIPRKVGASQSSPAAIFRRRESSPALIEAE
eukprot:6214346-Prymnesium_polylepis.1